MCIRDRAKKVAGWSRTFEPRIVLLLDKDHNHLDKHHNHLNQKSAMTFGPSDYGTCIAVELIAVMTQVTNPVSAWNGCRSGLVLK